MINNTAKAISGAASNKITSMAQAKAKLSEMVGLVVNANTDVIIESHGKPKAALISIQAYEEIQELRKEHRRAQALERLRAVREDVRTRNPDITTDKQVEQFAEEFSQEFIQMLKEKRVVRFERS